MAVAQFSLPKQWEDWCNWLLGIWLCISLGSAIRSRDNSNTNHVDFGVDNNFC
jgi:hypothetical protein